MDSSPPHTAPDTSQSPSPPPHVANCPNCSTTLGDPVLCPILGHSEYDGKWFQACGNCGTFFWHGRDSLSGIDTAVTSPTQASEMPSHDVVCPKCHARSLGRPILCKGNGNVVTNYGRWFQVCAQCKHFNWHNPPTPLEQVPEHVQVQFAKRKSMMDADDATPEGRLLCPNSNCLTSKNERKPANKECTRDVPHCSSCCKALGGCRKHKLSPREAAFSVASALSSNTTQQPLSSTAPQNSLVPTPLPTPSSGSQALVPRHFARAINPMWGKGLALAKQKKDEALERIDSRKALALQRKRIINAVFWHEAFALPRRFKHATEHLGLCNLTENNVCGKFLDNLEFIALLASASPFVEWVTQEISIPIPVDQDAYILLRKPDLKDEECPDLDYHIARFTQFQHDARAHTLALTTVSVPPPKQYLANPVSAAALSAPPAIVNPPIHQSIETPFVSAPPLVAANASASATFPLPYVVQMVDGMTSIRQAKGEEDKRSAFETAFPGIAFKLKTVYKHSLIFGKAVEMGLVSEYVKHGKTPAGKWSKLVTEVNLRTLTEDSAKEESKETPPVMLLSQAVASGREDDYNYRVYRGVKFESYITMEGRLNSYAPPADISIEIVVWDPPSAIGHKSSIHQIHYRRNDMEEYAALKCNTLKGEWYKEKWGSKSLAAWHEGARMSDLFQSAGAFLQRVAQTDTKIYDIEVLETFLLSNEDRTWTAQRWIYGCPLFMWTFTDEQRELLSDTLAALSHFIYEQNNGYLVHTDFQALINLEGLFIYDAKSHKNLDVEPINGDEDTVQEYDFPGSEGRAAIDHFALSHVCNPVCRSLKLYQIFVPDVV